VSTLLHIDGSARRDHSRSRHLSAAFAEAWHEANPNGTVVYRDLAVDPIPHVDEDHVAAMGYHTAPAAARASESWALSQRLIDEVLEADTILLGTPMYNFSVPSVVKAWLDRIAVRELIPDRETGEGPLVGKRVVVVTGRGGAYGPGTPRQPFDFQEPYLRAYFKVMGLDSDLTFIHAELTKAYTEPHIAHLKGVARQSLRHAVAAARAAGARTAVPA
jgi:FMN-dependent NADH-azoreductase